MFFTICKNCSLPSMEGRQICAECGSSLLEQDLLEGNGLTGVILEKRYRLEHYIDEGAMAWVYRGCHVDLGSSVAVKILKPSFQTDQRFVERFKQEAIAAGSLNHPNILSIITSDTTSTGFTYIISEFISGKSLSRVLEEERSLSLPRTVKIINQILSALDEAHSKGIIHRDIKPENVMVINLRSGEDFIKLVDFGIARQTENHDLKLTKHGELFGTPEYMSPEVIRGIAASCTADLYAVGVILFELLTGNVPFTGEVIFDVLRAHLEQEIPSISSVNPEIPFVFDSVIKKVLAKKPDDRPQSAIEFKDLLNSAINESTGIVQCRICGFSLNSTSKFCPNCGTNVHAVTSEKEVTKSDIKASLSSQSHKTIQDLIIKEKVMEPVFFGRESEIDAITSFLYSEKIVLEINGQSGIGKSTLSSWIINNLEMDSVQKFTVYPDPALVRTPWYSVRELLMKIMELSEEFTVDDFNRKLSDLRLEPDDYQHISRILNVRSPEVSVERAVKLREFVTSAVRVVLAAATRAPTILFFEDIDEYDYPSRVFIDRLITNAAGFPLKVIVTSEEAHLVQNNYSDALTLGRLDNDGLKPIILQMVSKKTDSWLGLFEKLFSNSYGLPLHLIEGIHMIMEGGSEVGSSLADIINMRIRRLPSPALRILQLCALYGRIVPLKLVYLVEGNTEATENAVTLLIKRGFVNMIDAMNLEVAHRIYSRVITSVITTEIQHKLHDSIRKYLISEKAPVHQIAYHTVRANRLDEAIILCEEAGDLFEKRLDDPGAGEFYRNAFEISRYSTLQGKDPEPFIRLSIKLGDVLRYTGQTQEAENVLKEGLLFCEDNPESEAAILSSLARLTISSTDSPDSRERAGALISRATRKVQDTQRADLVFKVYFDLSSIEITRQRFEQGAKMLREGMELMLKINKRPDGFWRLFTRLAELEYSSGRQTEAVEILMQALNLTNDHFPQWKLARGRVHYLLGKFFADMQRRDDALIHLLSAVEFLQSVGDRLSAAEASLAVVEMDPGKIEHLEKAVYLSMQIGWKQGLDKARRIREQIQH